jgi:hypothetical protein
VVKKIFTTEAQRSQKDSEPRLIKEMEMMKAEISHFDQKWLKIYLGD